MKLVIIDYNLSNIFSVKHACQQLGYEPIVTSDINEIESADALILPGVGAFGEAMKNLEELDLINPINEYVSKGKPIMGVCLGMQLMFDKSEEFGEFDGLGVIKGTIKKFDSNKVGKIPQIAWNQLQERDVKWQQTPLKDLKEGEYMYFVHSFYAYPEEKDVILSETNYNGQVYCSSVLKNNVFATQFHPEKSAHKGLEIYKNWLNGIKNN